MNLSKFGAFAADGHITNFTNPSPKLWAIVTSSAGRNEVSGGPPSSELHEWMEGGVVSIL